MSASASTASGPSPTKAPPGRSRSMVGTGSGAKKLAAPRPLKSKPPPSASLTSSSNADKAKAERKKNLELLSLLESLCAHLINGAPFKPDLPARVREANLALKAGGAKLDRVAAHREVFNRLLTLMRNACKDPGLDRISRLHLLEVVELRAMDWVTSEDVEEYYKNKLAIFEKEASGESSPGQFQRSQSLNVNAAEYTPEKQPLPNLQAPPPLSQQQQAKRSMSWKDEMVIRNADSGKVPSGASERLIQISGDSQASVSNARHLMEETIRRNVTPPPKNGALARSTSSPMASSYLMTPPPFHLSVEVGGDKIQISGANLELIQTAQLVLENYFGNENIGTPPIPSPPSHQQPASATGFVVTRLPLFPASSKEAVAEAAKQGRNNSRRSNFAATAAENKKRKEVNNNSSNAAYTACKIRSYTRDQLLDIGDEPVSRSPLKNWPEILLEFPSLLRKKSSPEVETAKSEPVASPPTAPIATSSSLSSSRPQSHEKEKQLGRASNQKPTPMMTDV